MTVDEMAAQRAAMQAAAQPPQLPQPPPPTFLTKTHVIPGLQIGIAINVLIAEGIQWAWRGVFATLGAVGAALAVGVI